MSRLVLTIGDPTGIGPEITAKALQQLEAFPDTQFAVVGNLSALEKTSEALGLLLPKHDRVSYRNIDGDQPGSVAFGALGQAVAMIAADEADALVTGPISKKNLTAAGHNFPGHTEILESLAHKIFNEPDARAEMLFAYEKFRLLLLTRHIALSAVPAAIAKPGAVARPLKTLIRFLRHDARIDEPCIALLALNPHAGEIDGDEEKKYLMPVLHAVNGVGATRVEGCFAADAFFRDFDALNSRYDAVVASYHDQGLIPFKMLAKYRAVNITIGLPFIRTSVGHGTAEDIVGKGIAREDGLIAAISTAIELTRKS